MKVNVVDLLVCQPPVVLQDVVVLCTSGNSNFLRDGLHRRRLDVVSSNETQSLDSAWSGKIWQVAS